MIHIYKDVERIQKGMRENQIKSEFRFDYNQLQSNRTISYILIPYPITITWRIYSLTKRLS